MENANDIAGLIETLRNTIERRYARTGNANPKAAAANMVAATLNMFKSQPQYLAQLLSEEIEDAQKALARI